VQAQGGERPRARIAIEVGTADTRAAVCLAVDTPVMPMHVAPREHDLQRGMERGRGHVATDEEATPDQRADTLHNDAELIDVRWDA
jgi:hypothetical protein